MLEKELVKKIKAKLEGSGHYVIKVHGGPYQNSGLPDLLAIREGKASWYEVKTQTGKVTPLQAATMRVLSEAGCVVKVVRSVEEI